MKDAYRRTLIIFSGLTAFATFLYYTHALGRLTESDEESEEIIKSLNILNLFGITNFQTLSAGFYGTCDLIGTATYALGEGIFSYFKNRNRGELDEQLLEIHHSRAHFRGEIFGTLSNLEDIDSRITNDSEKVSRIKRAIAVYSKYFLDWRVLSDPDLSKSLDDLRLEIVKHPELIQKYQINTQYVDLKTPINEVIQLLEI